ncbi:hypothetical protein SFC79_17125 [Nocardioides sp. S-58]|uniref:Uncharacterized protein n=1 Tax=Nocardioides renjunii TaxID=3095075 RepID=A0ABU5KF74_9ACTN|nr:MULTISPECIES: hypothetical protein [unclassified Nocardioides]MDZ5663499.1 hypothetical protein [Nocardioides sp. S-58]WQQ20586.1 hypothetical protein SHK17_11795 [Nocardioides sp. S-34]
MSSSSPGPGTGLPHAATLAWWLTAWLRGHEQTDHVLDALADDVHLMAGGSALDLLTHSRGTGASYAGLALPVEGDLLGLGGPRDFNAAALEAGQAVVVGDLGLVPLEQGETVQWQALPAARRQLPDVGEADRSLRETLLRAAGDLADLDVARWRPEAADALMNLHRRPALDAPLGTPPRCVDLAARGLQAWAIVDLALADDGGALSSYEVEQRRGLLQPLGRAARRAVVAACSPEVWPDR